MLKQERIVRRVRRQSSFKDHQDVTRPRKSESEQLPTNMAFDLDLDELKAESESADDLSHIESFYSKIMSRQNVQTKMF